MIIHPKLPSIFELFGIDEFKEILALDDMLLSGKRNDNMQECLNSFNEKCPNYNLDTPKGIEDWAYSQLEYVAPHFYIIEKKPIIVRYISNWMEVENEINNWFTENILNELILEGLNQDDPNWRDHFEAYNDYAPSLFDELGSFDVEKNKLSINLKEIKKISSKYLYFSFRELLDITLYHHYGHWISHNLNITFTPKDDPFNECVDFQELFANWCTIHILSFNEETKLLAKFKSYLEENVIELHNPYFVYPNVFQRFSEDIANPVILKMLLYCGRETITFERSLEAIEFLLRDFQTIEEWKSKVYKIKEEFWKHKFFNNEGANCLDHDVMKNFYSDPEKIYPYDTYDGKFTFEI